MHAVAQAVTQANADLLHFECGLYRLRGNQFTKHCAFESAQGYSQHMLTESLEHGSSILILFGAALTLVYSRDNLQPQVFQHPNFRVLGAWLPSLGNPSA